MEIRRSHNDERDLPSARLLSTSIFPILELNSMKDIKGYDIVAPNMNSLFFFQTIIHDTAFLAGKKHGIVFLSTAHLQNSFKYCWYFFRITKS